MKADIGGTTADQIRLTLALKAVSIHYHGKLFQHCSRCTGILQVREKWRMRICLAYSGTNRSSLKGGDSNRGKTPIA
jgi:hypothetical protein